MLKTLYDKIWDEHLVTRGDGGNDLIYIDRHFVHEVSSPQAFDGLRISNRTLRSPEKTIGVADHNVSTSINRLKVLEGETQATQILELEKNAKEFKFKYYKMSDKRQGIVHVIGPEQGWTLPGTTIVCGDSHTSTHGAFGALAHGIGTSEVEHVLATQTLIQKKSKNMEIEVYGEVGLGVSAKDVALSIIKKIGTAGGTGYVIEYTGEVISNFSMEERMTLCNMTVEAGARAGLIQPDEKTYDYLKGKPNAPKGENWTLALKYWQNLFTDQNAFFDCRHQIIANEIKPQVSWGTSPEQVIGIDEKIPEVCEFPKEKRASIERALTYMNLDAGQSLENVKIDRVFIGSCTNSRIEDLRKAAKILEGKKISKNVTAIVVPGSGLVREQAEKEGIDQIFLSAGFEWRLPGCSMCVGMNEDQLGNGERCASTSNRNFEGRQGRGGRTHLMSPAMAAAAAIVGHLTDVRSFFDK